MSKNHSFYHDIFTSWGCLKKIVRYGYTNCIFASIVPPFCCFNEYIPPDCHPLWYKKSAKMCRPVVPSLPITFSFLNNFWYNSIDPLSMSSLWILFGCLSRDFFSPHISHTYLAANMASRVGNVTPTCESHPAPLQTQKVVGNVITTTWHEHFTQLNIG